MRGLLKMIEKLIVPSVTRTHPMKTYLNCITALLICCFNGVALAKPAETTRYTYYTINGGSANDVYRAMQRRGPRVNGVKAYASTAATAVQHGNLAQGAACRIVDYRIDLDFVIRLPRISNEQTLPPADRRLWQQFSAFLRQHEETHRRIWRGCAADVERKVKAINAESCADASQKAAQLWEKMQANCDSKHKAFDAAEQQRLMTHPFIRRVFRDAAD